MLSQNKADRLLFMPKRFERMNTLLIEPGCRIERSLVAVDPKEKFMFDIRRSSYSLKKITTQNRVRGAIVLARLCYKSSPHTNPDGKRIDGTHLHLYREGWDDKWAKPLDSKYFTGTNEHATLLEEFCNFCKIEGLPVIQGSM